MSSCGISAQGTFHSVDHVQVVALYEPDSGRIRLVHMVTSVGGASPPSDEEAIAEAKARALRHNLDVGRLAVALSNDPEHGRCMHCIDTETKAFVPIPTPTPAQSSPSH